MRAWLGGWLRRWAAWLRYVWLVACWLAESAGYWVRPYDMLADARRWRWQPAQRCGGSYFARGGVVRGPSDPSDDSVPYTLSHGHAYVSAETARYYGADFLRAVLG